MSDGPDIPPPPEEPYSIPGTTAAFSLDSLPGEPLTAAGAEPFVSKVID